MKNLLVAILAVSFLSLPAMASNEGGKKKARKKAKTEIKKDNTCDPKNCDPKNCDPKNCDPKNCPYPTCIKTETCSKVSTASNNK
ncbi:MAG TPA: hypothetical protein VFP97_09835 [Chitinophagaceae bacterium]|nr:hypothetical protein [Chitinophagaceae bacterium]